MADTILDLPIQLRVVCFDTKRGRYGTLVCTDVDGNYYDIAFGSQELMEAVENMYLRRGDLIATITIDRST
jgi:hypothetical protein